MNGFNNTARKCYLREFLLILILIFSLESLSKADDISEFEIEGMSIGDSLLDYYNLNEIKEQTNEKIYAGTNKKFSPLNIYGAKSELYVGLQIHYKTDDNKFIIYGIDGIFAYDEDPNNCKKKRLEILDDISDNFSNLEKSEQKNVEMASERGYMDRAQFFFKNGDFIDVVCYMYNDDASGYTDHGRIGVVSKELETWIVSIK